MPNGNVIYASGNFQRRTTVRTMTVLVSSSRWSNVLRYTAGAVFGSLLAVGLVSPPIVSTDSTTAFYQTVTAYKTQIARDDVLLDLMLGGWDRSKPVHARHYYISNGSKVWSFTQEDSGDLYELSF